MKYLFSLLILFLPLAGMQNACMLYLKPTKQDAYTALMQSGLTVAQMASRHPDVSSFVSRTAFIIPALVAYKSEAIKTSIMQQLPQLDEPFNTGVSLGIKQTLLYGGIALAGYLFYTQTWEALTKGALVKTFAPLAAKAKDIKQVAQQGCQSALELSKEVDGLQKSAKATKDKLAVFQTASNKRNDDILAQTRELKRIGAENLQASKQLNEVLKTINIQDITALVKGIEEKYAAQSESLLANISNMQSSFEKNSTELAMALNQLRQKHASRSTVNRMIAKEVESDSGELFTKIIALANTVYATKYRIQYALELLDDLESKVKAIQAMSDSDSEYITSDEESDFESQPAPRGLGGSRNYSKS
ncbi:hypothetical protein BH09DEP1_BH09DEP1_8300 [soil metagenome]